jgi:hypothetical protein
MPRGAHHLSASTQSERRVIEMSILREDSRPIREYDVRARTHADEYLLLRVHVTMRTNAIGMEIWRLCDGRTTIKEMGKKIAAEYEEPEEDVRADSMDFVASLLAAKFVRLADDE